MTRNTGSKDSEFYSQEEIGFYWDKVYLLSAQVLSGERELADVPAEYLGDVIVHAFKEATQGFMSLDEYMRYITFSAFLRKRKEKAATKHCPRMVSDTIVELCE